MLPALICLIDRKQMLVEAWREAFRGCDSVEVLQDDFFSREADAMVSPANSFGIMDGGLDLAIRRELGFAVQSRLQKVILEEHHGELPVGAAEIVATGHARWPYLVSAPTMRVPEVIANTLNPYLAFRAALLAVRRFNQEQAEPRIGSLLCPGLGTGVGGMDSYQCARQMKIALDQVSHPARIPSFGLIHAVHRELLEI